MNIAGLTEYMREFAIKEIDWAGDESKIGYYRRSTETDGEDHIIVCSDDRVYSIYTNTAYFASKPALYTGTREGAIEKLVQLYDIRCFM